jgi:4-hydroxy-2-oxoheptanedioate aldolase
MSHSLPYLDRNSLRPLFGLCISYPAPGIIERIGKSWDWFWIDGQHGELGFDDCVELVKASQLIGVPGLVRVPSQDPTWVAKLLDLGAAGVIVPMVETVAEAAAMVQAAKFPPVGNRSYGGLRIGTHMGPDYHRTANRDTVLILQLESSRAAALADQFAAMEGVDGLFLGPDDLVVRKGGDVKAPKTMEEIGQEVETIARACEKHGKFNVALAFSDLGLDMAKRFRHQLVVGADDFSLLDTGSEQRIKTMWNAFGLGAPQSR